MYCKGKQVWLLYIKTTTIIGIHTRSDHGLNIMYVNSMHPPKQNLKIWAGEVWRARKGLVYLLWGFFIRSVTQHIHVPGLNLLVYIFTRPCVMYKPIVGFFFFDIIYYYYFISAMVPLHCLLHVVVVIVVVIILCYIRRKKTSCYIYKRKKG